MSSYALLFSTSLQQQVLRYRCGGSEREIRISNQSCHSSRALYLVSRTGLSAKLKNYSKIDKLILLLY